MPTFDLSTQVSLLNTTNGLPETMDFMVERYPYDHDVLQRVVSDIFGKLDDRNLPIVDSLLKAQGHFFSDRSGRERLLKELETSYSKKQFVRTLLGPLNESGENSPIVLRYDMELALQSRDLDKIKKLVKLGAVVPPNQVNRLLRNTKGNETIDFSGVIANDRYTAKELGEIVFEALLSRRWNLVDELLDNKGGVEPEINNRVLNQCMQLSKHERAFDAFKALLDVAGRQRQTKVAKGRKSAEQAGPLWLAEWEKFEKRVEERTK